MEISPIKKTSHQKQFLFSFKWVDETRLLFRGFTCKIVSVFTGDWIDVQLQPIPCSRSSERSRIHHLCQTTLRFSYVAGEQSVVWRAGEAYARETKFRGFLSVFFVHFFSRIIIIATWRRILIVWPHLVDYLIVPYHRRCHQLRLISVKPDVR